MNYKNRYLYYSILPCLLFLIAIGVYVSGYNPPTQDPPFGNLPAPINAGPNAQIKEGGLTIQGNLITEGLLKLAQFDTAPAGAKGALYYDTTANEFKGYKINKWASLGGWDGVLPNYTTAQRNTLSLVDGLIVYNTTDNAMQIYVSGVWRNIGGKLSSGIICEFDGDCDSTHCVDGVCCATTCEGNCNRCNVAGSEGICADTNLDCTGNCDVCSSGNCVASVGLCIGNCDQCTGSGTEYNCEANIAFCTGNCDQCTGSGTSYNCSALASLCTGNCSFCNGSDTEYNCAGSNGFCSNDISSCYCSGSDTVWNCQACATTGVCQTGGGCSNYTCLALDNRAIDSQPSGCTGCNYCNGTGSCVACRWKYKATDDTCHLGGDRETYKCKASNTSDRHANSSKYTDYGCSESLYRTDYQGSGTCYEYACYCN